MVDFLKGWQVPSGQDAKVYVEAVRRLSQLFCLVSLLPVVSECRFTRLRSASTVRISDQGEKEVKPAAGKGKAKARAAAAKGEEQDQPEAEEELGEAPLGLVSMFFLLASEAAQCWKLFTPPDKKNGGPMTDLVQAIKKAAAATIQNPQKKSQGTMDGVFAFVQTLLKDTNIFSSIHALVMLGALLIVLCHMLQHLGFRPGRGMKDAASRIFRGVLLLVPVVVFVVLDSEKILKMLKAVTSEKIIDNLWLPLRAAALLSANPPALPGWQVKTQGGTPPLFAAFQVASLFGLIFCELIGGDKGVHQAVGQIKQFGDARDLVNNPLMSVLAPMVLSIGWLYMSHLTRRPAVLFISIISCFASQPILVAMFWPKVAAAVGTAASAGPALLMQLISVTYSMVLVLVLLMGGTMSVLSICALMHLLTRIHGTEIFGGLFPQ